MSKIEQYKAAANVAAQIRASRDYSLGRDSPRNDKHTATCHFHELSNAPFSPMKMQIDCSYGYYGSSSGYSATSQALGKYLARAITLSMPQLLDRAVALAESDAEKARKAAEDEARSVLDAASQKSPEHA